MKLVDRDWFLRAYKWRFGTQFPEHRQALWDLYERMTTDDRVDDHFGCYLLATIQMETSERFEPIQELGSDTYFRNKYDIMSNFPKKGIIARDRLGNVEPGDGKHYRPRGYCIALGRKVYERLSTLTGEDLIDDPDRLLDPNIAYEVMVQGALEGAFTNVKWQRQWDGCGGDFKQMRRVFVEPPKHRILAYQVAEHFRRTLKDYNYVRDLKARGVETPTLKALNASKVAC